MPQLDLIAADGGLLLAILAAISVGALLKGMTGLGLPLFAVPALAAITSVEEAVILMIIPGIGANLAVVISRNRFRELLRSHVPFLASGFVGGLAGTGLLHVINDRGLKVLLATWLALYLVQYVTGRDFAFIFRGNGRLGYLIGLCAGTSQGATGISAQIVAPYYHGRSLQPPAYAFLVAFTFLLFSTAQMTAALATDLLTSERLQLSLIALVPTLIFTRVGISFGDRISAELFNRVLFVVFLLLEIKLIADVI